MRWIWILLLPCLAWGDVTILSPDGVGTWSQWKQAGCTDHYECIDETVASHDDATTYVEANDATDTITVDIANYTDTTGKTIDSVVIKGVCYGAFGATGKMRLAIYSSSVLGIGDEITPDGTWTTYSHNFGAEIYSWTALLTAEAGAVSTFVSGKDVPRMTAVDVYVYWTAASASSPQIIMVEDE